MAAISQTISSNAFLYENFWIFIEMCSLVSNWKHVIIDLDNGLTPNRQQAIIWTNGGVVYWCVYDF